MHLLFSAISGLLFGMGLFISQMTDPTKVIAFLDLSRLSKGTWDPSLIFVMAAGFLVMAIAHLYRRSRTRTLLNTEFGIATANGISKPLIFGSAAFGVGWGLAGYCPGPAIASLAFLPQSSFIFVAAMAIGSLAAGVFMRRPV